MHKLVGPPSLALHLNGCVCAAGIVVVFALINIILNKWMKKTNEQALRGEAKNYTIAQSMPSGWCAFYECVYRTEVNQFSVTLYFIVCVRALRICNLKRFVFVRITVISTTFYHTRPRAEIKTIHIFVS